MSSKFQVRGRLIRWTLPGVVAVLLAGCGRDDIKVYRIAKSDSSAAGGAAVPATASTDTPPAPADSAPASPQLSWTLPPGWQEKPPAEMRVASFSAPGKNGQSVDVSVVPLPGMAGGDLNNVNRWRGQVGLDPVQDSDLTALGEDVMVGDAPARLYDLVGTHVGAGARSRILAVALHRDELAWFFKATGDDDSVGSQKGNFISLLKSIQFNEAANPLPADHPPIGSALSPTMTPAPDQASPALPTWTVPAAWHQEPPSQMLLAKFSATENDAQAEITVSSFPGDVGGLLANVNRWRGQVSLPPLDDTSLAPLVTTMELAAGPASVTDFTGTDAKSGQPARLVGVILPLNGQTWFYKLMGDATVVEHQKADFLKFVQSAKY